MEFHTEFERRQFRVPQVQVGGAGLECAPVSVGCSAGLSITYLTMASPQRLRPWVLLPVAAVVIALSSRLCLAWQGPTSSHSGRVTCFPGVSSQRRCGLVAFATGRRVLDVTRQSRWGAEAAAVALSDATFLLRLVVSVAVLGINHLQYSYTLLDPTVGGYSIFN